MKISCIVAALTLTFLSTYAVYAQEEKAATSPRSFILYDRATMGDMYFKRPISGCQGRGTNPDLCQLAANDICSNFGLFGRAAGYSLIETIGTGLPRYQIARAACWVTPIDPSS